MDDLVAWLREQIDEDEQLARAAADAEFGRWPFDDHWVLWECEAKRAIIESCQESLAHEEKRDHILDGGDDDSAQQAIYTLKQLAEPYAKLGRPGYQESWRP